MEIVKRLLEKKSVKNGVWLYLLQFFNTIVPITTIPYITRVLGAEGFGFFSFILNIVLYLQVVVEYGFNLSATRSVVFCKNEQEQNELFSNVFVSRVVLFILTLFISITFVLLNNYSKIENICFFILSFGLFGICFEQNWLFQGKQEMKFITISSVIARSISTILIFILIRESADLPLYCLLYTSSIFFANVLGSFFAFYRFSLRFKKITVNSVCLELKKGLSIFFTQMSAKIFGAIGVTLLGIFSTEKDVGIYSALYKIPYILLLLWNPLSQILYPIASARLSESFEEGVRFIKKSRNRIILIFFLICIPISLWAKPISSLMFGLEYSDYFYIIYPLLVWMLLGIYNNFMGIQMMVGAGFDKEYGKCFQIGVACTVFFNLFFIYLFGLVGASLAPCLSELTLSIILNIMKAKIYGRMMR